MTTATTAFLAARDLLLAHRDDYEAAYRKFAWPRLERFNWALDYFDPYARGNRRCALHVLSDSGAEVRHSFDELSERSHRVASFLARLGIARGSRMLVMLPNVVPLWELMLAAMKLGAVLVPATTLLSRNDLADRVARGRIDLVVAPADATEKLAGLAGGFQRIAVGPRTHGWLAYEDAYGSPARLPRDAGSGLASDPLLLYFTSGTTARPKLVLHTHQSYPVGHLSTMYWIGLKEGDRHLNISSPGWAKHAWSSCFAPWNAGATVMVLDHARFDRRQTLAVLAGHDISTFCAPPTVWRMLILEDLAAVNVTLREAVAAGEPLNPEVIERVKAAWGLIVRDGYGQTETTAAIANSPGQPVKVGAVGRPLPGYQVALLDHASREVGEGEIALRLDPRPLGLMAEYVDDPERFHAATAGGYYRTGDEARRDGDGFHWYVGRGDDVFKSADYRISPFELESVLLEHHAVAEAAVVPSPDPLRLSVPKAFITLKPGTTPGPDLAREIFEFAREHLSAFQRIRSVEFSELPKTISGKIRRVQLRALENERRARGERGPLEFREEDFG